LSVRIETKRQPLIKECCLRADSAIAPVVSISGRSTSFAMPNSWQREIQDSRDSLPAMSWLTASKGWNSSAETGERKDDHDNGEGRERRPWRDVAEFHLSGRTSRSQIIRRRHSKEVKSSSLGIESRASRVLSAPQYLGRHRIAAKRRVADCGNNHAQHGEEEP